MKWKNLPYVRLNGGYDVQQDDDSDSQWSRRKRGELNKQSSISLEVLTWTPDDSSSSDTGMSRNPPPLPPKPISRSASANESPSNSDMENSSVVYRKSTQVDSEHDFSEDSCTNMEVICDYEALRDDELSLERGVVVQVLNRRSGEKNWIIVRYKGKQGLFPLPYLQQLGPAVMEVGQEEIVYSSDPPSTCEIGRGAFAGVYRAIYRGQEVALKKLHDTGASKTNNIEKMRREAMTINLLQHDHIIKVFGVCLEEPKVGLLLELCEGGSLKLLLQAVGDEFISVGTMVDWARQISSGMAHMIGKDYIHRDLKSDNVLVKEPVCLCRFPRRDESGVTSPTFEHDPRRQHSKYRLDKRGNCVGCGKRSIDKITVKITDFGSTKDCRALTGDRKSLAGTYFWLAPEAYKKQCYSEASDVWAFGVLMWEMLTREEPYKGKVPIMVCFQVCQEGSTLSIGEDCPIKWGDIMKKCWEMDCTKRPTFEKLTYDFEEYHEELKADHISLDEEDRVRRVQRQCSIIAAKISAKDKMTENDVSLYMKKFNEMYETIDDISSRTQSPSPPKRKARVAKGKQTKLEISDPIGWKHLVHIEARDLQDMDGFGTLPRKWRTATDAGDRLLSTMGKKTVLSTSSPNLHQITVIDNASNHSGTLQRKGAVKSKQRERRLTKDESQDRPIVEVASENDVELMSPGTSAGGGRDWPCSVSPAPVRTTESAKSLPGVKDERRDSTDSKHKRGLFGIFRNRNRNDNRSTDEDSSQPRFFIPSATRQPIAPGFVGGTIPRSTMSSRSRTPTLSAVEPSTRKRTTPKTSPEISRPEKLPTKDRFIRSPDQPLGIDDPVPSLSEDDDMDGFHHYTHLPLPGSVAGSRHTSRVSQDLPHNSMVPHHSPQSELRLSDRVPPMSYSTDVARINDDPYVWCGSTPPAEHNAYSHMVAPEASREVSNPAYLNMPNLSRPGPGSLPLDRMKISPESESSGIGSTLSTERSMTADGGPPLEHAPPVPSRPPAIPPREGKIPLPAV